MDKLLVTAYLCAAVLFILSLSGLAKQETARRGNVFGILGMAIALAATLVDQRVSSFELILGGAVIGGAIGAFLAARVAMTSMPELVAALHSFVGLAAVLVGLSTYLDPGHALVGSEKTVHDIEVYVDVAIGAITFTGSVLAYLKLSGKVSGKPLLLPGRHGLNALMAGSIIALGVVFTMDVGPGGWVTLLIMTGIAAVLGLHLVAAIGGADMPVVVSLLNSYSGWTAAAAGFMLDNDLLIVTGALVGSSGAILSYIMCHAMNRSIWNVVFGGFGTDAGAAPAKDLGPEKTADDVQQVTADDVAELLDDARTVIVVPGYGMAVAQAQHAVNEMEEFLRERDTIVRFAIHPVAGRLPGHMNVLLAEADVPYDIVLEMDEINEDFDETDLVLVIGANDIVNPGALDDPSSPIYGMPVLEAWKAKTVVVFKRSMRFGYAGVTNPLFFHENTQMLFGDAKKTMNAIMKALHDKHG